MRGTGCRGSVGACRVRLLAAVHWCRCDWTGLLASPAAGPTAVFPAGFGMGFGWPCDAYAWTTAVRIGYAMLVPSLVMDIQEHWLVGDDAVLWITVIGDLGARIGGLPAGFCVMALLLVISSMDLVASPLRYREQADFLSCAKHKATHSLAEDAG